jgi:O-antigen/teichoic acid export membrane protein
MLAKLGRILPRGRFTRRLTMLSGGTMAGQLLLVASSPFLTRLYGPEEFGVLAVFTSVTTILGGVMTLCYQYAVPVCRDDADAAATVAVGLSSVVLVDLVLVLVLAVASGPLAARLGIAGFAGLLWLAPFYLLLWGWSLVLAHWSIRGGTYRLNALGNLIQSATQAGSQLGLGLLPGAGAGALVLGYSLGPLARCLVFLKGLEPADRAILRRVSWARLRAQALAHRSYPLFTAPATLLESAASMLPTILVAVLYGPAAAGWFGLGQRITGMPVRMLAEAGSNVFLGEIAQAERAAIYRLVRRTSVRFAALGLVGMLPLLLAGPPLFALVFGEPWREAGSMVQLLVPLNLARFVVVPVSQTLNVLGRQNLRLVASLLTTVALGASFALGAWLGLPQLVTIALYSAGTTLAFLFFLGITWHVARQAALAEARPAPSRGPAVP